MEMLPKAEARRRFGKRIFERVNGRLRHQVLQRYARVGHVEQLDLGDLAGQPAAFGIADDQAVEEKFLMGLRAFEDDGLLDAVGDDERHAAGEEDVFRAES